MRNIVIALVVAALASTTLASNAMAGDSEVSLAAGKGEIHGALRTPDGFTHGPAVLIIAGSGPTDRDGNSTVAQVHPDSYKLLADALEKAGVPSLRYDKRGAGRSMNALLGSGAPTTANAFAAETELKFADFSDDAAAFARLLAAKHGVSCVVILGHSEGSLLGMLAAQKVPICGYISVAGVGRPFDVVILEQLATQLPPDQLAKVRAVFSQLKAGKTVENAPIPALFRPSIQPYLISELQFDPTLEIARIKAPVLIVQGDNDIQVSVLDAERLAKARPDAKLTLIPGMNHVLKDAPRDRAGNIAVYADAAKPLDAAFVAAVVGFVKGLAPRH